MPKVNTQTNKQKSVQTKTSYTIRHIAKIRKKYKLQENKEDNAHNESEITHPPHYNHLPNGIECWDVTEHFTANIAQAMKYQWRSGRKNGTPAAKDLRKAIQFIQREIDLLEGRNPRMNKHS
jgi:uncharacterized coiled-coil protein SlyX